VLAAQAAIDAASALIAFSLARSLFGAGIGVLTLAAMILFPLSAYYTLRMLPEALFTLAFIAAVASFRSALATDTIAAYVRVGVLGGVAALVKPVGLLLVPIYGLILFAARRPLPWRPVAVMFLCQALVIAPWTVRNWVVSGYFVPVATGAGFSLWVGNNLITGGVEEVEGDALLALDQRMRTIAAAADGQDPALLDWEPSTGVGHSANITPDVDRAFAREALREMKAHPAETLVIVSRKVVRLWFSIGRLKNQWAQGYVALVQGALLTLAGWGIVIAWRRGLQLWPLLVPIGYVTAVHALTFSTLRYSIPLMPLVIMFAVFGALDLCARVLGRLAIERPAWLAALQAER
ncbi:MAG: hypothetical protein HKO62_01075, partial [Gammaproteobacteria bacterium]|nr:hypothetical protein [Gammaproteobacteria bacterium]